MAGGIACLVPEPVARRVWPGWAWLVPALGLAILAYLLRGYFLR